MGDFVIKAPLSLEKLLPKALKQPCPDSKPLLPRL